MGTQHQDVIVINGKKYDAVTGKLISESADNNTTDTNKAPAKVLPKKTGTVIDGFVKSNSVANHKTRSTQTTANRNVVNHKKPTQKSHTLMRNVVKKPSAMAKSDVKPVEKSPISKPSLSPSPALQRAASVIKKSPLVSRYGDVIHRSSVVKKVQVLPVKAPVHSTPSTPAHITSAPVVTQVVSKPLSTRSRATSVMLEKALASATTHESPQLPAPDTRKRRKLAHKLGISARTMAISSSVLAGVLLGGFFAIQNVPNLSMRVAAAKAGFNASMPGYSPSGFSFKGPIDYSPGQVTRSFHSNTDDRSYTVSQKASSWNSDALLSNFVATSNKQYQTYLDRGRTLYIYDGSNATWIDNGVWYQVEGKSDMTTDQLVRIAASI